MERATRLQRVRERESKKRISQPIQLPNIVAVLMLKQNNDFFLPFFAKITVLFLLAFVTSETQKKEEEDIKRKKGDKQWIIPLIQELFNRLKNRLRSGQEEVEISVS